MQVYTRWGTDECNLYTLPTALEMGTSYSLNDTDNGAAWMFSTHKDGIITHVGVLVKSVTGVPPNYQAGLVGISASEYPTTTPLASGSVGEYTFSAGFQWCALPTPTSVTANTFAAVHIWPTTSAPDASNYIAIPTGTGGIGYGVSMRFATGWLGTDAGGCMAVKYSDGEVYGCALTSYVIGINLSDALASPILEAGAKFTLPVPMTCFGMRATVTTNAANSQYQFILYDANNNILRSTAAVDRDVSGAATTNSQYWTPFTLSANTIYRAVVKDGLTGNAFSYTRIFRHPVESYAARAAFPLPDTWHYTQRPPNGAWEDYPLTIPMISLWISELGVPTQG